MMAEQRASPFMCKLDTVTYIGERWETQGQGGAVRNADDADGMPVVGSRWRWEVINAFDIGGLGPVRKVTPSNQIVPGGGLAICFLGGEAAESVTAWGRRWRRRPDDLQPGITRRCFCKAGPSLRSNNPSQKRRLNADPLSDVSRSGSRATVGTPACVQVPYTASVGGARLHRTTGAQGSDPIASEPRLRYRGPRRVALLDPGHESLGQSSRGLECDWV